MFRILGRSRCELTQATISKEGNERDAVQESSLIVHSPSRIAKREFNGMELIISRCTPDPIPFLKYPGRANLLIILPRFCRTSSVSYPFSMMAFDGRREDED